MLIIDLPHFFDALIEWHCGIADEWLIWMEFDYFLDSRLMHVLNIDDLWVVCRNFAVFKLNFAA